MTSQQRVRAQTRTHDEHEGLDDVHLLSSKSSQTRPACPPPTLTQTFSMQDSRSSDARLPALPEAIETNDVTVGMRAACVIRGDVNPGAPGARTGKVRARQQRAPGSSVDDVTGRYPANRGARSAGLCSRRGKGGDRWPACDAALRGCDALAPGH